MRNVSTEPASFLALVGRTLYSFFCELAQPLVDDVASAPPTPEEMQRLYELAQKYEYWMASPSENSEVELFLG